jgi:outer membrane protein TolC
MDRHDFPSQNRENRTEKKRMQGTIEAMVQGKTTSARRYGTALRSAHLYGSVAVLSISLTGQPLLAQSQTAQPSGNQPRPTATGPSTAPESSPVATAQQQLYTASGQNGATVTQDSYKGSIVEGKSTGTVLDLSLDEAIQRGLRNNLGIILQGAAQQNANGQRLEELQALLPTATGAVSVNVQQVNLAAYGLKFPGVNPIVGPFQVVDFRGYLTQNLLNISALQNYIASKHNFASAKLTAEDARDLVVLTVGNAYLLCIASSARIDAVTAELATSKITLDQAIAAHNAGTSPKLDVLRAQVDYQNGQQTLISAKNDLAKDKLALARTIGLPLDQEFRLTDLVPYAAFNDVDPQATVEQALKARKDLAASGEQVQAARAEKKSAWAYQLPVLSFTGDFGDLGTTPGHSHSSYSATGQVTAPILQVAKTRGQNEVAAAQYEQARARLADQAQQVNQDVRNSILDIQAAAKLVEATHSNVELANEALSEAQQRFKAGVSDNLPVSQAQAQTEQANDQYISALYQHNLAKLSLARALGAAQTNYKDYLGGK